MLIGLVAPHPRPRRASREAGSRSSPSSRQARSGPGWPFYVSNLAVTAVLAFAANTSFGGLPVLLSLLAKDHRMPHAFYLRAEKPIYRIGIVALAIAAGLLLIARQREDERADPSVRDRRVHRLHDQPDRPGQALAPGALRALAGTRRASTAPAR